MTKAIKKQLYNATASIGIADILREYEKWYWDYSKEHHLEYLDSVDFPNRYFCKGFPTPNADIAAGMKALAMMVENPGKYKIKLEVIL